MQNQDQDFLNSVNIRKQNNHVLLQFKLTNYFNYQKIITFK